MARDCGQYYWFSFSFVLGIGAAPAAAMERLACPVDSLDCTIDAAPDCNFLRLHDGAEDFCPSLAEKEYDLRHHNAEDVVERA